MRAYAQSGQCHTIVESRVLLTVLTLQFLNFWAGLWYLTDGLFILMCLESVRVQKNEPSPTRNAYPT